MLGSSAFAGWTFSCLLVPRLGDLYGRKWAVWVSLLVAFIAHLLILISKNLPWTIFLFFVYGACCAGRYSTAYVYLVELMPPKHRDAVGSFTQFADAGTFVCIPLYFIFITKNWLPF
jgi:MFS family permease